MTLKHRWPTALALACTVTDMIDPEPMAPWTLLVLAFAYLTIGALRRTLRPVGVLRAQLAGAAAYLVLIGAAIVAPDQLGVVLVGLGWLAHAGWDWWHHRHRLVVPRAFAEWCGVVDAVIGGSVLAYAVLAL